MRGVEEQVQENLAELARVGQDERGVVVLLEQTSALPDLAEDDLDRRVEHAPHVDVGTMLVAGARERLHVQNDAADPLGALEGIVEACADFVQSIERACRVRIGNLHRSRAMDGGDVVVDEPRHLFLEELQVRDDVRQRVVDLVGDARGECAEGRHPVQVRELLGVEDATNGFDQGRVLERFLDVRLGVDRGGLRRVVGGQGDDRDGRQRRVALLLDAKLPAVLHWHHEIEQDEVGDRRPAQAVERLGAVRGLHDVVPVA